MFHLVQFSGHLWLCFEEKTSPSLNSNIIGNYVSKNIIPGDALFTYPEDDNSTLLLLAETEKKKITPIGRTAVRQTNVSRYRGRPMRALLKLFGPSLHFCIEAPLVRLPLLPRNVRLSDSCTTERCCFSGLSSHNSYTPDQNFHPLGIMERIDEKIVWR